MSYAFDFEITDGMKQLLRDTVDGDFQRSHSAKQELATALALPLKKGGIPGDTVTFIFEMNEYGPGEHIEYPYDFVSPGTEKNYVAYTVPHTGYTPQRQIEGDFVSVPTFDVATSLDWPRKYAREARWDIVGRAMKVMEGTFTRKRNNDGWHTIITAAYNRGLAVYDDQVAAGLFTKRVVSLAKTIMRRNAGGNSTSVDKGKLTHLALSPEMLEDIRSWDLTQVDDVTRRQIFISGEGEAALTKIFGVTLVDIDEFGVAQEYQKYYENTLGGTMSGSKVEIMLGLDLMNKDSFLMPWRRQANGQLVELLSDPVLIRENREGYFARQEYGVTVLDSRRTLLLQS